MTVQAGLCLTWSETKLLVFSCSGSNFLTVVKIDFFHLENYANSHIDAQIIDCGYLLEPPEAVLMCALNLWLKQK